jgi:hypothetical protein
MVFLNVTGLKGQKLDYSLSHYLNLEKAHILYRSFTHDSRINYHGPRYKFGNKM